MRRDGWAEGAEPRAASVAIAWLAHPASLAGIALLLLNDHVLKAQVGSWWTGKLSDVAGLMFAPALVAVLAAYGRPSAPPRAVAATSLATVGLLFALAKATPGGAALASDLWPSIGGPGLIRADATDLLALPALGIAWLAYRRARLRPASGEASRRLRSLLLIPAVFAVAATSPMPEPPVQSATSVATEDGRLLIGWSDGRWAASTDGYTFAWVNLDPDPGPVDLVVACVPSDPDVCYRAPANLEGIQATHDGGEIWVAEWPRWNGPFPSPGRAFYPIAVLETADAYRVFVVTGGPSFAVRLPDGTWTLVRDGASDGVLIPPRVPAGHTSNVDSAVTIAFAAFLLALLFIGVFARDRNKGWGARRVLAWIPVALAGLVASALLLLVPERQPTWDIGPEHELIPQRGDLGVFIILASLLMLLGFRRAIPTGDDDLAVVIIWAAFVGLAAGLARLVPLPPFVPLWTRIPLVAVVAGAALAVALARLPSWMERNQTPPGVEK